MLTYYWGGKPHHISSDNICFKSRWGWKTPAPSQIKGRSTWEIMNFEERRENLTEGEKWFVFWIFIQLYTITFTITDLNSREFVIFFAKFWLRPPWGSAGDWQYWARGTQSLTRGCEIFFRGPAYFQVARSSAYFHSSGFSILVSFRIFSNW